MIKVYVKNPPLFKYDTMRRTGASASSTEATRATNEHCGLVLEDELSRPLVPGLDDGGNSGSLAFV